MIEANDSPAGKPTTGPIGEPAAGPIGEPVGAPVGRRVILGLLALGGAGIFGGAWASRSVANALGPVMMHDPTGLLSVLPLGANFRIYSVTGSVRTETAATYELKIGGLVDTPMTHTLADLQAMEPVDLVQDFHCVTGWSVPQVPWRGVRLGDLIDAAGPQSGATAVKFTSFDGVYTESLSLADAHAEDALVAWEMLGAPVAHEHGGPVRAWIGGQYGYKSTKWLSGIELTKDEEPGYWEHRGYAVDGTVLT